LPHGATAVYKDGPGGRNGATRIATRTEKRPGLKMQEIPGFIG
jgi:hypothetical protein